MPDCGVHYLWFAFVCFLIRSHPPIVVPLFCGVAGDYPAQQEGEELTRTAHETFDGRAAAVAAWQHSVLVWFALREQHSTAIERRTMDYSRTE